MSDNSDNIIKPAKPKLQSGKKAVFMVDYTDCDISKLVQSYGEGVWTIPKIQGRVEATIAETTGLSRSRCDIHYGKLLPIDKTVVVGSDISVVKLYTNEEMTFVCRGEIATIDDCGILIKFFYSFD